MIIKILDYVRQGIFIAIFFFMCFSFGYFCYNPTCQGKIVSQKCKVIGKFDFSDYYRLQIINDEGCANLIDVPKEQFDQVKVGKWYPSNETKELELPFIFQVTYICGILSAIIIGFFIIIWLICGSNVFTKKWWYDNF